MTVDDIIMPLAERKGVNISAATGEGVKELLEAMWLKIKKAKSKEPEHSV